VHRRDNDRTLLLSLLANGAWRCSRSIPANGVSQRQKQEGG
jgi:hypothetical protein